MEDVERKSHFIIKLFLYEDNLWVGKCTDRARSETEEALPGRFPSGRPYAQQLPVPVGGGKQSDLNPT